MKTIQVSGAATGPATTLGIVICGKPLGSGLVGSIGTGTVSGNVCTIDGRFKQYFNLGTCTAPTRSPVAPRLAYPKAR